MRDTEAVSITPILLWNNEEWRCRYVFGYSLDDSDKPIFLVWPERTENNGFWILDVDRDHYHNLCQVPSVQNLGLEHFYAAFGLGCSRNLRTSSARALGISEDNISEDCSVSMELASPNGSDSEASSSSQSTSTVEVEDIESDLEDLEEHYYSNLRRYSAILERDRPRHYTTQQLNTQEWDFHGGRDGLERFLSLPATWPLARLMFPIRDLRKQMETLLQTYCFETAVTCAEAKEQSAYVRRMALHLGQYLAIYLAETITGLLQKVLTHPAKGLVDETNAALLTQKLWVQAIYTELLCASSRFRAVREKEQQRPPNGLVKVVCLPFDGAAAQKHGRKKATDARFETMIGPSSWVDSLFVWFPAAWMPLVIDALREKSYMRSKSVSQLGAVAFTDRSQFELPEAQEFSYRVKRWQVDQSGCCPVLQSRINVDWLTFDPQMFAPLFPRLYEGILHDVFIQKAAVAWDNAPSSRIMVSLLLPGPMEADQ